MFEIHLHLGWTTKDRKRVLAGEVGRRVREASRQHEVTISRLVPWLKGRSSHHLLAEFAHLRKAFWGRHVWARDYFCCSSGHVTDEVIKRYLEEQGEEKDDDFKVEGEREGGFSRKSAAFSRHPKPPLSGGWSIHFLILLSQTYTYQSIQVQLTS